MNFTSAIKVSLTGVLAVSSAAMALAANGLADTSSTNPTTQTASSTSSSASSPAATSAAGDNSGSTGSQAPSAWPPVVNAPAGDPNIVLILIDDAGFGWSSTYGGPVQTPSITNLANHGIKYNEFSVNSLCSPTRASLLTGRNDHEVGFGTIAEAASPAPGYNSIFPKSAALIPEVLRENGYSTAAFGKWHNTPAWELGPTGPFDHWPSNLGFEYWYGFQGGESSQYEPRLYRDTVAVEPPSTPEEGYNLNHDLANEAIHWLRVHDAVSPDKPFFLYYATGAIHAPHHVPKSWITEYKGKFNQGWDVLREQTFERQLKLGIIPPGTALTRRPKELPAWSSLTTDQKKLYSHQAEVYAAYMAQTDYEVGRVLDELKSEGHVKDTAIFFIDGDNGASGEGGLEGSDHNLFSYLKQDETVQDQLKNFDLLGSDALDNHVASAWAWAADTPFQWMKQVASHLGGTRDPLIVSWPGHVPEGGGIRSQFSHVTDIVPTIYDITRIPVPDVVDGYKQLPIEGESLTYTFNDPNAPSRHHIQYFEMSGNRGIYDDGWWAGQRRGVPWDKTSDLNPPEKWELYNLTNDFSQAHNLADVYPDKLKQLQALFESEAVRNQVYPLNSLFASLKTPRLSRTHWIYRAGVDLIPAVAAPRLTGFSHTITAYFTSGSKPNGVIVAEGGRYGGFTLYAKSGRLVYEETSLGGVHKKILAPDPLPKGRSVVEVDYHLDINSRFSTTRFITSDYHNELFLNGNSEGSADFQDSGSGELGMLGDSLDVGSDKGSPVSFDYIGPDPFNGDIDRIVFDINDPDAVQEEHSDPTPALTTTFQQTSSSTAPQSTTQ